MRTLLVVGLIALSCHAHADDWASTDTTMLVGALTLTVIDWGQTRDLAKRQRQGPCIQSAGAGPQQPCVSNPVFEERANFFLPAHPTTAQVDRNFVIGLAATAGLSYALPQNYRRWFLGAVIVLESVMVIHNHHIGLRVSF